MRVPKGKSVLPEAITSGTLGVEAQELCQVLPSTIDPALRGTNCGAHHHGSVLIAHALNTNQEKGLSVFGAQLVQRDRDVSYLQSTNLIRQSDETRRIDAINVFNQPLSLTCGALQYVDCAGS